MAKVMDAYRGFIVMNALEGIFTAQIFQLYVIFLTCFPLKRMFLLFSISFEIELIWTFSEVLINNL